MGRRSVGRRPDIKTVVEEQVILVDDADVPVGRMEKIEAEINGRKVAVTFAVGWADCQKGQRPQELLDEADKALYLHKQTGKKQDHTRETVSR